MNSLTFYEVVAIKYRLRNISDTWADLWISLHYLPVGVGRLVRLRYTDIKGDYLFFERRGRLKEKSMLIIPPVGEIIRRRRDTYPDDDFVFQSHSNRVKAEKKPVSVISFNRALKIASLDCTSKTVTSKSA